jgi:hypothetical protein
MTYFALGRRNKLAEVIAHLDRFDPKMAHQLTRATEKPAAVATS